MHNAHDALSTFQAKFVNLTILVKIWRTIIRSESVVCSLHLFCVFSISVFHPSWEPHCFCLKHHMQSIKDIEKTISKINLFGCNSFKVVLLRRNRFPAFFCHVCNIPDITSLKYLHPVDNSSKKRNHDRRKPSILDVVSQTKQNKMLTWFCFVPLVHWHFLK